MSPDTSTTATVELDQDSVIIVLPLSIMVVPNTEFVASYPALTASAYDVKVRFVPVLEAVPSKVVIAAESLASRGLNIPLSEVVLPIEPGSAITDGILLGTKTLSVTVLAAASALVASSAFPLTISVASGIPRIPSPPIFMLHPLKNTAHI